MSFLITGCGRSGTMFTARLFNELGVRTSHEEFFTAYTPLSAVAKFGGWLERTRTMGEVSGLAAPWVSSLLAMPRGVPGHGLVVAILVRNPVAVIASLMGLKDYSLQSRPLANIKFNFRHLDAMSHDDEPLTLAMKYWLWWNHLAREQAPGTLVYRVEEIHKDQGQYAIKMLRGLGVPTEHEACEEVLEKLGTRLNGGPRDPSVSWRTLPKGELKDAILAAALTYGYTLDDLESYCPLGDGCPHCGLIPEES